MSKTQDAKRSIAIRREMRLRREKTAALLMPWFLQVLGDEKSKLELDARQIVNAAAKGAVNAADILLAELDRTAPKEPATQGDDQ